MSTATRVIKNTGFLYAKMGISFIVSLYTTRLILASLGASDFGIFQIVAGSIGMLGFLNSTLANATQRYMSYAEGEGDLEKKKKVFNVSLVLHITIAFVTAVLLLLAIIPLFSGHILRIDPDRIASAKIVYLCLIFSTVLTIINVPYDAIMTSHENMLYYSIIGIMEALLKLIVAFVCVYSTGDKLIIYALLMAMIPLISLSIMKIYCHRHYEECIVSPRRYWDASLVHNISGFFGWNFMTAVTSLFTAQGIGIVLNHFYGTVLNAAQGVANQLNAQLSSLSLNLMKALNPVVTKNAGAGDIDSMNRITIVGCKYSTYLVLLFSVPFILEMEFILGVWLKDVPQWTRVFCTLQLVQTIICQVATPAATAIYAKGEIKYYAIYKSIMNAAPLFVTFIAFILGGSPIWLYIPMIFIWALGGNIVIIYYAKKKCGLEISEYCKNAVIPVLCAILSMLVLGHLSSLFFDKGVVRFLLTIFLTTLGLFLSAWFLGMNTSEKETFISLFHNLKSLFFS